MDDSLSAHAYRLLNCGWHLALVLSSGMGNADAFEVQLFMDIIHQEQEPPTAEDIEYAGS